MDNRIQINKMSLEGFGPYYDKVTVAFNNNSNSYIANNEMGKSSLVNGILAVIFGLNRGQGEFSTMRFKNWQGPRKFEGEIQVEKNGDTYKIWRNFETHEIAVHVLKNNIWKEIVTGNHNPGARKANPVYEEKISELFNINSRELFMNTFCICQPIPEGKNLDNAVQELLSGGGADFQRVGEALLKELKEITRFTADRGVTTKNQTLDRDLEKLNKEIDDIKTKINVASTSLDSLDELQTKLAELENKIKNIQGKVKGKQDTLNAWTEWKRLREIYKNVRRDKVRIANGLFEAKRLQSELSSLENELKKDYPEFLYISDEQKNTINDLSNLCHKIGSFNKDKKVILENTLLWEKELSGLTSSLEDYPWLKFSEEPTAKTEIMKNIYKGLTIGWDTFRNKVDILKETDEKLDKDYKAFNTATEEQLERAKKYNQTILEQEVSINKLKGELELYLDKKRELDKKLEDFSIKYADIEKLGHLGKEKIEEKLFYLQREKEIHNKLVHGKVKGKSNLVPFIISIVLAVATSLMIGLDNPAISITAALFAALIGYFVTNFILNKSIGAEKNDVLSELAQCKAKLSEINGQLGSYSEENESSLGRLLELFRQRDDEIQRIEDLKAKIKEQQILDDIELQLKKSEEQYNSLKMLIAPIKEEFCDVELGYSQWLRLKEKADILRDEITEFAKLNYGSNPQESFMSNPKGHMVKGEIRDFALFIEAVTDIKISTIEELCNSDIINNRMWQQIANSAIEYKEIKDKIKSLKTKISHEQTRYDNILDQQLELSKKRDILYESVKEILEANNDLDEVKDRMSKAERIKGDAKGKAAELNVTLKQNGVVTLEDLDIKGIDTDAQLHSAFNDWKKHIEKFPALPAMDEEDDERINNLPKKIEGEINELTQDLSSLEDLRNNRRDELSRILGLSPTNIAMAELELKDKIKGKEQLELMADGITTAYKELTGAVEDYQLSFRNYLQDIVTEYYIEITNKKDRRVIINSNFEVTLEENEKPYDITSLSKGAQDQLYLSLRVAIGDLLAENIKLPFIFDDPFVNSDEERLSNIKTILSKLSQERQVIILSHREDFVDWGTPIQLTNAT